MTEVTQRPVQDERIKEMRRQVDEVKTVSYFCVIYQTGSEIEVPSECKLVGFTRLQQKLAPCSTMCHCA